MKVTCSDCQFSAKENKYTDNSFMLTCKAYIFSTWKLTTIETPICEFYNKLGNFNIKLKQIEEQENINARYFKEQSLKGRF